MLRDNYLCALDIGSSKIAAVAAKIVKGKISNLFYETQPVKGMKAGILVNSVDLAGCLEQCLKQLRARSGIPIKFVYANISGQDIVTRHARAIIPLAERGNKVIMPSDIEKVNEQARILGSSLEEEIIHQIPFSYTIDSKAKIANPLGLYSHKLEVDLYLVCGKLASIQGLVRAINQAGLEVQHLFFSGISTSEVALDKEARVGTTILCDIGGDITELLLFKDGALRQIEVLSLGGDDLTQNLSDELKIPLELAEELKRSDAAVGDASHYDEAQEILIKKHNAYLPIRQRVVIENVTARAKTMCQQIKEAADKLAPAYEVNNFIATGRTILLEGLLEMLESSIGTPVRFGRIAHPDILTLLILASPMERQNGNLASKKPPEAVPSDEQGLIMSKESVLSGQKYLTYLTALGIVCQVLKKSRPRLLSDRQPRLNILARFVRKVNEMYQEYF